jgi:hypothetical protein
MLKLFALMEYVAVVLIVLLQQPPVEENGTPSRVPAALVMNKELGI